MDETVKEFLIESNENLNQLDRDLVELENSPDDRERLSAIFRTIHTIKGTCGFLAFGKLERVAHAGENLLSKLRDGVLPLTPEITSGLLEMVDAVREILGSIEQTEQEGERDDSALIEKLQQLQKTQSAAAESPAPAPTAPDNGANNEMSSPSSSELQVLVERMLREQIAGALQRQREGDSRPLDEILADPLGLEAKEAADAQQTQKDLMAGSVASSNIRVDVAQLDKLMNLVGELVLARNQILQFSATQQDGGFLGTAQRLNLVTTELQEGIMKTRMQPISNVWNKLPRVVRDLSVSCGKQVDVEMEGKETELDKTLIEAIKDPLTHLIRNSVDHGIELPDKRVAAGKPATGKLLLRAFHEGGQVNIEVIDDGGGIDIERVKRKAVERGLISPQKAAQMPEREAIDLLFLPGFSTAQKVTNVSGRGVGMDVVRTNIEKIGGSVDIQSSFGAGTTIRVKIPLTLAIIPALMVAACRERFAIPQVSLLELVRLEGNQIAKRIELIHGAPVYRLRGKLLPLINLGAILKLKSGRSFDGDASQGSPEALNIVVLQADERQFGLVVDEINDTEEIVVKPLGRHLKGISTFAGATILGDGDVALILDVLSLAKEAEVVGTACDPTAARAQSENDSNAASQEQTLLLLMGPDGARFAVPLESVSRLEEFPRSVFEKTGDQLVVQYRTQIMPVVFTSDVLKERRQKKRPRPFSESAGEDNSKVYVVVLHSGESGVVGLGVNRILDIVDVSLENSRAGSRPGVVASVVIQGCVTELLDVESVNRTAHRSVKEIVAA